MSAFRERCYAGSPVLRFVTVQTDRHNEGTPSPYLLRSVAAEWAGCQVEEHAVVHVQCFTDPLSAWCWAVEPAWLHLAEVLGSFVSVEHRMAGLLQTMEPSEDARGFHSPSQLSMQWEEAAHLSGMPLYSDIWFERPIDSSWPACAAVKAAQAQDPTKAAVYLRRLREAALCRGEDISDPSVLERYAALSGLNPRALETDLQTGVAGAAFTADLSLAAETGAVTPPVFFFFGPAGVVEMRGPRSFEELLSAVERVAGGMISLCPSPYSLSDRHGYIRALVRSRGTLTAAEAVELFGIELSVACDLLDRMTAGGSLSREKAGTGFLYTLA